MARRRNPWIGGRGKQLPASPERIALWRELYERGEVGAVCDEIVRSREVPRFLLARIELARQMSEDDAP